MLARSASLCLLALATTLVAAGCFNAPKPNCAFLCGDGNSCPDEYQCSPADGRCHLVVNGEFAVCEDTLPLDGAVADGATSDAPIDDGAVPDGPLPDAPPGTPDAAPDAALPPDAPLPDAPLPPDAEVPDAEVPDAEAPDAFFNHNPSFTTVTTPVNAVAGATVAVQVEATDQNPEQTLTYSAAPAGTNRSYEEARVGAPGDTVGGDFDPATRTFTLSTGILGTFDITFTVSDGHTPAGTATAPLSVVVSAHPVRINEVQAGSTTATRNLEIINAGAAAVDVSGWRVVVDAASFQLPPATSLGAGGLLVLHAATGIDSETELFSVQALDSLPTAKGIALFASTTDLALSRFMRDFVKWGAGGGRVAQANFAGQWPSPDAADFVDTTNHNLESGSIARTPGANSESAADWYLETMPTLGAANVP